MSLQADQMVDRRRLSRRVSFWRIISVLLSALFVAGVGLLVSGKTIVSHGQPHIARVSINGLITGDKSTLDLLDQVQKSKTAQAVILSIESPGGTVSGSEVLYESIRKLSAQKPVVAVVGNTAASGAYIAAIGADHIVSRGGAIVGSIGVIAQIPNATKLLGNIGVEMETVRSSPLKASPSGVEPTPPEARKALEAIVLDSFVWFKDLVKERRKLTPEEMLKVADGRVFTGRQALPLKLIDELGGESEAKLWLEREKKIATGLDIEDWKKPDVNQTLGLFRSLGVLSSFAGFPALARQFENAAGISDQAQHAGLMAIWLPVSEGGLK